MVTMYHLNILSQVPKAVLPIDARKHLHVFGGIEEMMVFSKWSWKYLNNKKNKNYYL